MTPADVEGLLAPISTDDPCGPNLEYDAAFTELERVALGRPEQQVGSTIVAAADPDWGDVEKKGRALLSRSKDLRVATHLAKASLRTRGLPGFALGITLIRELLEHHWEGVHPRLDPDDQNDPTARLNVLAGLADPATLNGFRTAPLISSRAAGRFSLRDVELAAGEVAAAADGAPTVSASMIEGAAGDTDLGVLGEMSAVLAGAAARSRRSRPSSRTRLAAATPWTSDVCRRCCARRTAWSTAGSRSARPSRPDGERLGGAGRERPRATRRRERSRRAKTSCAPSTGSSRTTHGTSHPARFRS